MTTKSTPIQLQNVAATGQARPVQHVAIVGGGTAGWMAAATLRRRLGCQVTVIESPDIPAIGVGEATIPSLLDWLENMEIDQAEFMRQTGATYKLAIRFDNWIQPQHRYWHPFGICGIRIDGIDLAHFWQRGRFEGWLPEDTEYSDFSLQRSLCQQQTIVVDQRCQVSLTNYAYHLDAARLATFLSQLAQAEGATRIVGTVAQVELADDRSIASLKLADQLSLSADLYLDCTGFAAVLIEKALGVPWIDHSHQLLCDRAVVVRKPHADSAIAPYTVSSGLSSGWAWQIPLENTIGCGYVYSSKHLDSAAARDELLRHVGLGNQHAQTRELKMRIGRRQSSWHKNCVAIGLTAGFVEPLESTGIFMVQRALDDLVDCLTANGQQPSLQPTTRPDPCCTEFNSRGRDVFEEIRDFVLLHYIVSQREDTPFWRDARSVSVPDSLARFLEQYGRLGKVTLDNPQPVFAEANHHFIMTGAGHRPATELHELRRHPVWKYRLDTIRSLLHETRGKHQQLAAFAPTHTTVLAHPNVDFHPVHRNAAAVS